MSHQAWLHCQPRSTTKDLVLAFILACFALSGAVTAQIGTPPDSGELLQQQQRPSPAPSLKKPGLFKLRPPKQSQKKQTFYVSTISVVGNQAIDSAKLRPLIVPYQDRDLSFSDLQFLCYQISEYYRQQGFIFTRAVVPHQELKNGQLHLRVIEAKLDEIVIDNDSAVANNFLNNIVKPAKTNATIEERTLNRALLLLQDIPGIDVITSIHAGQSLGMSDLQIKVTSSPAQHQVSFYNFGGRHTHRANLRGTFNFDNLVGRGDLLSLSLNTSGERLLQTSVNYDIALGGNGHYGGVNISYLDYSLGENLKDLNAEGKAKTAALYLRSRWARGITHNWSSQLRLQRQSLDDQVNNGATQTKRVVDSISLSLNGDVRNWLSEASINSWLVHLVAGDVTYGNTAAQTRDELAADNQGRFHKLNINLRHLQALSENIQLSINFSAQKSFSNLDSSQKQTLAGPHAVRAYDVGTLSGDSGYLLSVELQRSFDEGHLGRFSLYGFIDAAKAELNTRPWSQLSDDNHISLAGAGLGLRWQGFDSWNANMFAAAPIGNTPTQLGNPNTGLLWFEMSKMF